LVCSPIPRLGSRKDFFKAGSSQFADDYHEKNSDHGNYNGSGRSGIAFDGQKGCQLFDGVDGHSICSMLHLAGWKRIYKILRHHGGKSMAIPIIVLDPADSSRHQPPVVNQDIP
jgi:hypothetical protein